MRAPSALAPLLAGYALAACASGPRTLAVHGGVRQLEDASLVADDPGWIGVEATVSSRGEGAYRLGLEAGWGRGEGDDDGAQRRLEVDELFAGVRLSFVPATFVEPYASFGLAWLDAELDEGFERFEDRFLAPYVGAGFAFRLGFARTGIDLRYLVGGDAELGPADDLDGPVTTAFLGVAF